MHPAISKALADVLDHHRKAQMRWDFIFSENSTGFHSPQESARVLQQSVDLARSGQLALQNVLAEHGISLPATVIATMPILFIYPFLQKYFAAGVMVGAVKE